MIDTEIIDQLTTEIGIISLTKDKLITFVPHPGITSVTLKPMAENMVKFLEWTKDEKLPFLTDNRQIKVIEPETRLFVQKNLPTFCSRHAIILENGLSYFMFNIFMYLNRPSIPVKAFKNKEEALIWLKMKA